MMEENNEIKLSELEEVLETEKSEIEASIRRKIKHVTFARALVWFYYLCKRDDFVYPREIAKKIKTITTPRAWQILAELEKLGFARRVERGGEKVFVINNNSNIEKWVREAVETIKKFKEE